MFRRIVASCAALLFSSLGFSQSTLPVVDTVTFSKDTPLIIVRGEISDISASSFIQSMTQFPNNTNLTLWIDSPGGSVLAFGKMVEAMKAHQGKITCVADYAASAAFMLFQYCDERLVTSASILMQHQGSFGLPRMPEAQVDSFYGFIKSMVGEYEETIAARLGLTVEQYEAKYHDDWWLFGRQSITQKTADRLVNVKCAADITKLNPIKETVQVFIFTFDLEWSRCPTIYMPLSVNGTPLFYLPENLTNEQIFDMLEKDNPLNNLLDYLSNKSKRFLLK